MKQKSVILDYENNKFDHLKLLITDKDELREAFAAGVIFGREKELEMQLLDTRVKDSLDRFESWFETRKSEVLNKLVIEMDKESYILALEDAKKMFVSVKRGILSR